ncbi:MAG: type II toxin-antitoxin system RelE/ParE family toxin [Humidesulfovibrio sp.]
MSWTIFITNKATKQIDKLSPNLKEIFEALLRDLQQCGPQLPGWPHFQKNHGTGKIECYHCHLQRGKPTWVAIWRVLDKRARQLEIRYVGTHEKADYQRHCGV